MTDYDFVLVKIAKLDDKISKAANNEENYYRQIELMDGDDWRAIVDGSVIWETNKNAFFYELADLLGVSIWDITPTNTPWQLIQEDIKDHGFYESYMQNN